MSATRADIDVIIPAYNAEATIRAAIESVQAQSLLPARVVVVDDGSIDGTSFIAQSFVPGIDLIRQNNAGQGAARQHGADHWHAEYILFLDADDVLKPHCLETLFIALSSENGAALAYGEADEFAGSDPAHALFPPASNTPRDIEQSLEQANFIRTPGCAMIRRSAFDAVGGWDVDRRLSGIEDWDLWLRLAEKHPFARTSQEVMTYRVHGSSFSKNRGRMFAATCVLWSKRYRRNGHRRQDFYQEKSRELAVALVRGAITGMESRDLWVAARACFGFDRLFPLRLLVAVSNLTIGTIRHGRAGIWIARLFGKQQREVP